MQMNIKSDKNAYLFPAYSKMRYNIVDSSRDWFAVLTDYGIAAILPLQNHMIYIDAADTDKTF